MCDRVAALIGVPPDVTPTLKALGELLDLTVHKRPDAPLEVFHLTIRMNAHAEEAPQLARGIARHLARDCDYAERYGTDEDALTVVLLERYGQQVALPKVVVRLREPLSGAAFA